MLFLRKILQSICTRNSSKSKILFFFYFSFQHDNRIIIIIIIIVTITAIAVIIIIIIVHEEVLRGAISRIQTRTPQMKTLVRSVPLY